MDQEEIQTARLPLSCSSLCAPRSRLWAFPDTRHPTPTTSHLFSAALKSCLRLGLSGIPTWMYRRLFPRDVIGLCYHMVTDEYPPHVAHISPYKTPAQFEADLQHLTDHYEVISYEELCERRAESEEQRARKNGSTSPALRSPLSALRPAVALTFDDGLREHLTVVRPLLERYEIPAIFFITTDFLDNRRLFYRHKVSLCIDRILGLPESEWHVVADRLRRHEIIDEATGSQPSALSSQLSPSAFISWIKRLTCFDEPTIDAVCECLGVDCQRFLDEQRPYLTTDEVLSLADAGFTVGAHGVTHTRLSDLLGTERRAESEESRAEGNEQKAVSSSPLTPDTRHPTPSADTRHPTLFDSEIVDSCRIMAELMGRESVPFAFPFSGDCVPRAGLAAIRDNHPQVGMIFDRRGFRADTEFVVHRIIADKPPASAERGASNLPSLIRREYVREARAAMAGSRRGNGVLHRPTRITYRETRIPPLTTDH